MNKISGSKFKLRLPKFKGASINTNKNVARAKYSYVIHIRKLKRKGYKDKFYKLGKKVNTINYKNVMNFKNIDRGIYSIRYQIVITKGKKVRKTKWSKKILLDI